MNVPVLVPDQRAADFADGVYSRVVRSMAALAVLAAPLVWIRLGQIATLAFVGGSAIALLNFYWLKRTIQDLIDRTVSSGRKPTSFGVLLRFLFRYVLIAIGLYVIFKGSATSAYGLIGGLSLPVGAVIMEAVYQTFRALRHGL
ncbi:MAG TPA: ATP synthase subunit I [Verrucomicrobiae bacterium]|nr:ATP synthase subunit I [Verrucomicrobiae bacterium]